MQKKTPALSFSLSDAELGKLLIVTSDDGLRALIWNATPDSAWLKFSEPLKENPSHPILRRARKQLDEYFVRKRTNFDLPLAPRGTPFQLRAWQALRKIPYGKTISYAEQARPLGGANLARAVGSANRVNPIAIVVPCHRVIAANGNLTGFLYGLDAKRFLIELERVP